MEGFLPSFSWVDLQKSTAIERRVNPTESMGIYVKFTPGLYGAGILMVGSYSATTNERQET